MCHVDQISWLLTFSSVTKKLAIVERLFWQLGTCFRGNCHCREVAVDCPPGQKKVAVVERCPKWRGSHQWRFDCRPFHQFFQLLTWTSLGRSVDITGKSTLKLVNLPTWMGGRGCAPYHIKACKISRLWGPKLSNLTNLKVPFPEKSTDVPSLHVKSWRKPWKGLLG